METRDTQTSQWDQESFEKIDRRRARGNHTAAADRQHDFLHLDCDPEKHEHVHAVLREHTRHTDSVHMHGGALFVSCAPSEAAGLRARLDPHFKAKDLEVMMSHSTFAAGSDLAENLGSLTRR